MSTSTAFISTGQQHDHSHAQNRFAVIPTPQRLGANAQYTGRGVTIAVLDSGFYPHPDLAHPENRIVAFKDVTGGNASLQGGVAPLASDWHGTQTSVVAAGNGYLSDGGLPWIGPRGPAGTICPAHQDMERALTEYNRRVEHISGKWRRNVEQARLPGSYATFQKQENQRL